MLRLEHLTLSPRKLLRSAASSCFCTARHVQCFEEARRILLDLVGSKRPKRLEGFDYCLGLMEMNR